MKDPLISVNLLLFQPGAYLRPCLNSIFAQSYKNFELLIIDNNSQDGTVEKVKELLPPVDQVIKWRFLENNENLGYAKGHNLGIRESSGELVALVNQDVILDKDFLKNIAKVFEANEQIGSAQGKLLRLKVEKDSFSKTKIIDTVGLCMLKNRRIIAWGQGQEDAGNFEQGKNIFGTDGALPVYRRAALEDVKIKIGLKEEYLDESFFMYKEDVDLAWRLLLYGWQSFYLPAALAWHARTAGDSAKTNYFGIIGERLKINKFSKYQSFKNQRLMQIKNEQLGLLLRHFFYFAPKEIASWIFVLLFEHYTWKSIKELLGLAPQAWKKRAVIMSKKRVSVSEMEQWFK